jgi:hypothetical protein
MRFEGGWVEMFPELESAMFRDRCKETHLLSLACCLLSVVPGARDPGG